MYLETDRLRIRDFKLSDIDDLYEIFSDDEVMEYIEPVYDRNKTLNFLKEFCIEHKGAFACVNKENEKVIGYIIFNEYEDKVYELGWIFNKEYWGKGYAYESCDAVIKYAFSEMKISCSMITYWIAVLKKKKQSIAQSKNKDEEEK